MNHPRIQTSALSDNTIKALMELLIVRYYAERESNPDAASAALLEADKIQRFLDR